MTFCSDILSPLDFDTDTKNLYGRPRYVMQLSVVISVTNGSHFTYL